MKFPTIMLGIPHVSLLIVNEKQQLMNPSSFGPGFASAAAPAPPLVAPAPALPLFAALAAALTAMGKDEEMGAVLAVRRMAGVMEPEGAWMLGLKRRTQEVRTAFWVESKATLPYFCLCREKWA